MSAEEFAYVEMKGINKSYGDFQASKDINFQIEKGKLVALLGPSGSGKSTILRLLAGLETEDSGDIIIGGKRVNNIAPSQRGIGFVFQNYALFRYKTVYENIAFGLKIEKWKKADIKKRVDELVELVGLKGMENRYPSQLSGGQRQRVAFARALAVSPQLLLLDEPFAAIDAKIRHDLRIWLKKLINEVGITSIFVTHDQEEAIEVADQIIVTNHGRIEQIGSPLEIYKNPGTSFVAEFMGHSSHILIPNTWKGFQHVEDGVDALIRPEYVTVTKDKEENRYPLTSERGTVTGVYFRGNSIELDINVKGQTIKANRMLTEDAIETGEEVNVFVHAMNILKGESTFRVQNGIFIAEDYLTI